MGKTAKQKRKVLLIDQEPEICDQVSGWLSRFDNIEVSCHCGSENAMADWRAQHHELVICEARLRDVSGLDVLEDISIECPDTQVILISEEGEMEDAVAALRLGAVDFIMKPLDQTVLTHAVERGLSDYQLKQDNRNYREELEVRNRELKESLRLLREDQEAGRAVQLRLLPPFHYQFDGLLLDYTILPSLYLSGDFIDYFKVSEKKLGFYLADVSGHGASSAFITILLKNMANRLQRHYREHDLPELTPAKILAIANDELIPLGLGKHLAVFCAVIDTENNVITYCSAAHFPPPILMSGDEYRQLTGTGLPVGLFEGIDYEETVVPVGDTFKLIMFSDGVLELIALPSVAEKEAYLLEMVRQDIHNINGISAYLGLDSIEAAPDDIAVLTVSRGYSQEA
ncbi:MAG: fused response regulator/phosphatase [Ketobacteraceae bacterium]|nr:fused response regulator/phosphatase [Ketobacteraceae bacterium]